MSSVIWKFELDVTDVQRIKVPSGAVTLTVQTQNGIPCLWMKVDPEKDSVEKTIRICGTGHPAPEYASHIGSFQLQDGAFVGHVFEEIAE